MPNIDEKIAALKEQLNPGIKAILPSRGIPSASGGRPSSLTTWTELKIFPEGVKRRGRVVSGGGTDAKETWVLPLPQDLTDVHSMQYETVEFGALAVMASKGISDIEGLISGSNELVQQESGNYSFKDSALDAGQVVGEEVLGFVGLDQAINVLRAQRRKTVNPNMENLFKTSNLRTFQFSWSLTPLSSTDSSGIKSFISSIKKNIYPTNNQVAGGWNRLKYPSEFMLNFYSSALTSGPQKIFSTAACACTDLTIGYTPNGAFHTHTDGAPTTVTINGTFQELYTLDSVDIGSM